MSSTAKQLDRHAPAYSAAFAHFEENRIVHEAYGRRIANHIERAGLKRILSLGIGHTEVARPILDLLRRGLIERYVVVDAAPAIIASFRDSIAPAPPGLDLVEAFFEQFEMEDRFDAIEAGFILEHVDDPALVLRRLLRFAAEGARMFVAVPNARSLHRLLGFHAGLLPDMYRLGEADRALGHQRYFDVASLGALVRDCGWCVQATEGLLLKPFTTAQLGRLELPPEVWGALQQVAADYPEISNAFCMELSACG